MAARCEDWPCCGHEAGCCPDFDEAGTQLNMKCTCGATVPLGARSSICDGCMRRLMDEDGEVSDRPEPDEDEYDDVREQFVD